MRTRSRLVNPRQTRLAGCTHVGGRERTAARHGIYHCQQAAEKAIKGWLQSQDKPFPKTHDIEELVAPAAKVHGDFKQFAKAAVAEIDTADVALV